MKHNALGSIVVTRSGAKSSDHKDFQLDKLESDEAFQTGKSNLEDMLTTQPQ
jgi:hypothetical protein